MHQPAVLVSSLPPSSELHDRMYADLVASLIWSRNAAEKRALTAEARLHALHEIIASKTTTSPVSVVMAAVAPEDGSAVED